MSPRPARRPKACGPPRRRRRPRCGPLMKWIRTSSGPQWWGCANAVNTGPFVVSRYIVTHRAQNIPAMPSRASRLLDRREEGRLAPLGRGAVDEQPKLVVVAVRELEHGPRLDDEHAPALEDVLLRVVARAHVDRQRPVEDNEDLLLHRIAVAAADRAGRIAKEVR